MSRYARWIVCTENAINVRPGTGVWKTVTALGTVRVRVEGRRLTEAECRRDRVA